jgi:hypothetical protein
LFFMMRLMAARGSFLGTVEKNGFIFFKVNIQLRKRNISIGVSIH